MSMTDQDAGQICSRTHHVSSLQKSPAEHVPCRSNLVNLLVLQLQLYLNLHREGDSLQCTSKLIMSSLIDPSWPMLEHRGYPGGVPCHGS
jgi:hypothetical protein